MGGPSTVAGSGESKSDIRMKSHRMHRRNRFLHSVSLVAQAIRFGLLVALGVLAIVPTLPAHDIEVDGVARR